MIAYSGIKAIKIKDTQGCHGQPDDPTVTVG